MAILNTGAFTRTDGTTGAFADAALTYFSGQSHHEAVHNSEAGRFARSSKRQLLLEWLGHDWTLDELEVSRPKTTQVMPLQRMAFAELEKSAGESSPQDADLAKKLSLMRQDVGSFSTRRGEIFDHALAVAPDAFDWHA